MSKEDQAVMKWLVHTLNTHWLLISDTLSGDTHTQTYHVPAV